MKRIHEEGIKAICVTVLIAVVASLPMPGIANTLSVITAPESMLAS
mgnify:CR=1 FL=1